MVRYQNLFRRENAQQSPPLCRPGCAFSTPSCKKTPGRPLYPRARDGQSKFKDIGIAERKLGFESAHKICQDYVREQLRTKNEPFYPSQSVLERQKEELELSDDDEFFDAINEHWWMKSDDSSCCGCFGKKKKKKKTKKKRELP